MIYLIIDNETQQHFQTSDRTHIDLHKVRERQIVVYEFRDEIVQVWMGGDHGDEKVPVQRRDQPWRD